MRHHSFAHCVLLTFLILGVSLSLPVRAGESQNAPRVVVECFSGLLCPTPGNGDVLRGINNLEGSYAKRSVLVLHSHVDIHPLNGLSTQQRWLWYQGAVGQFSLVAVNGGPQRLVVSTLPEYTAAKLSAVKLEIDKALTAVPRGSVRLRLDRVVDADGLCIASAQVNMTATTPAGLCVTFAIFEDGVNVVEGGTGIVKWNHYVRRYAPSARGTSVRLDRSGGCSVSALIPLSPTWTGPVGVCVLVQDMITRQVLAADWAYTP